MLFYFIRHGQTEANRQRLLAGGGLDHPLNQEGHAQAKQLAEIIRAHIPHPVHRLVVSHLTRARETAAYLSTVLGVPVEINDQFGEWILGEWEGKSAPEHGALLLGETSPREGEARADFYARIERAWNAIHSDDEPYVIVSHGGVWLALQDLLKIPRFPIPNCGLVKLEGPQWKATLLNGDKK